MYDKAMTYYSSNDYIKAIPLLEEAANMGDEQAAINFMIVQF